MERMSTLDAGFFFVEHKNVPRHLGSLMVFGVPAPARAVRPARAAGSGGAHGS
jgi:hypothetical protein